MYMNSNTTHTHFYTFFHSKSKRNKKQKRNFDGKSRTEKRQNRMVYVIDVAQLYIYAIRDKNSCKCFRYLWIKLQNCMLLRWTIWRDDVICQWKRKLLRSKSFDYLFFGTIISFRFGFTLITFPIPMNIYIYFQNIH